jgi:hypothetical protein
MKIKQEVREEGGQIDRKGKFSRFKDMVERNSRVALAAFAVTFAVSCGDDTTGRDGGVQDGGTTDADTDQDGGTVPDGGPSSLCTQYGPGDAHRMLFHLEEDASPSGGTYFFNFRGIGNATGVNRAIFTGYPASMSTSEGWAFELGEQQTKNFPGIGVVTFELCEMTANICTPSTGDLNCTATLASSNGW